MKHLRLDSLLVSRGLFESKERAQCAILAGDVQTEGSLPLPVNIKPGTFVSADITIKIKTHQRYVSRGGEKLEYALDYFVIDAGGKICMDVGSSTGGFTDCLLKHNARLVHAIDVGRGQLHWSLRKNPHVITHEGINARYLQYSDFTDSVEIIVVDVSFISLTLILPPVLRILASTGHMIILIKPQFELDRKRVGKGGIVRDPTAHLEAIGKVYAFATGFSRARWMGMTESPIVGRGGNKEFFAHLCPV
ncbi:Hemolysin A [Candidatus Xiphinematobacter sp. Idaho Grape]|uniref:TlyA family RNA methyltransferase n=1 Tax=Candidatus Xiphinematobacter sp. Idaho Grape TaxID=1704307 RepID=UPI000706D89B|nr:TlyA family RNA methyltransferase [Candidatus Xiphinematobacter sp. Idaho Grape]ALJ56498.1 Hemolysin A [Candidatus Xiphinematobacter sp. Idaho Grape]